MKKQAFFPSFVQKIGLVNSFYHSAGQVSYTSSIRFTFTGKERDEETGYNYHGARYYDADLLTCWQSVDPLADKYLGVSPYNYCAWNPVRLVDPNGKEIYYIEGADKFVYRKGQDGNYGFFNKETGEAYSGNNSQFVNDLATALGNLKEGEYGTKLVDFFEGSSERDVDIFQGRINAEDNSGVSWNANEKSLLPVANSINDKIQLEETETFVSLGHELSHHRDRLKVGTDIFEKQWSEERKEKRAMLAENFIRREHGMRQRTYYGKIMTGYGSGRGIYSVDYNSYRALTLPIFPAKNSFLGL